MTTSSIALHNGVPAPFLNENLQPPIAAYAGPDDLRSFEQAGICLFTFYIRGDWWVGPEQYDFAPIDDYLTHYIAHLSNGFFMPRIDLSKQGFPWWGKLHPGEMNVLCAINGGEILDQTISNPHVLPYLGHEVDPDNLDLHSFHSSVWREEAGRAVASLVAHCESQAYAERIWAWHLCDGLFCEWFHWNEYSFDGMADYSPTAQTDFQIWLQLDGLRTLHFPRPTSIEDAYTGSRLGVGIHALDLDMQLWNTKLLYTI
jgi:hypothetical protein